MLLQPEEKRRLDTDTESDTDAFGNTHLKSVAAEGYCKT
jgi:hypothetical protein